MNDARILGSRWHRWLLAAMAAGWAIAAIWVVPHVIGLAYAEQAHPILNGRISGRAVHPVTHYLGLWRDLALRLTALMAFLGLGGGLAIRYRKRIGSSARELFGSVGPLRDRDIALLAVLFGILSGLAEACQRLISFGVFHRTTALWVSSEIFWMAPLAASVAMLAFALPVMALRRWTRLGGTADGLAPFLFTGLAVFSLGRAAQVGIHWAALLILAAGVATQVTRSIGQRTAGSLRWARRGVVVGTLGVALWGILHPWLPGHETGPEAGPRVAEASAMDAGTAAGNRATNDAPNILIVLWDTVRARSLSLYGYGRPTTPNLDAFAAGGVVFDAAITTAPWTLPAHASLFTGRYHHELSVGRQSPLDDTYPTLAEALGERGYRTGGFVANNYWLRPAFGLARGFERYEDRPHLSVEAVFLSTWLSAVLQGPAMRLLGVPRRGARINAAQVNRSVLRWIDEEDERPFFAFLNLYDAHEPYLPPAGVGFEFSDGTPRYTWDYRRPIEHSSSDLAELTDAYDSCVHYLDRQLGLLLDELGARGVLENTLVIVTSDHGETIGEHGSDLLGHENNMFYDVLQVPLVFHFPARVGVGARYAEPVSTVDVPATILDLIDPDESASAGGADPPARVAREDAVAVAGNSFAHLLLGGVDTPDPGALSRTLTQANPASYHLPEYVTWPISKGPLFSLIEGRLHYIVNSAGEEQLFNPWSDPWETRDLVATPEGRTALPNFRAAMSAATGNR